MCLEESLKDGLNQLGNLQSFLGTLSKPNDKEPPGSNQPPDRGTSY